MNTVWCSERRQTATCVTFWGLFVDFSLVRHRKMSGNINVTDHNTLPVLDNIRNMKPYSGSKMRTIQGLKELRQRSNSGTALITRFGHMSHKSQSCSFISHLLVRGHGRAAMTTKDPCLEAWTVWATFVNECLVHMQHDCFLYTWIDSRWVRLLVEHFWSTTLLSAYAITIYVAIKCRNQRNAQWYFQKQVFQVKIGAPNSKYLLVMVSTFVTPFSMDPLSPRITRGCIMQK